MFPRFYLKFRFWNLDRLRKNLEFLMIHSFSLPSDDEKSGDERPKSSSGESSKYITEFDVLDKDSPSDIGGSSGTS